MTATESPVVAPATTAAPSLHGPRRITASHPHWPLAAMFVGYPLWWALGVANVSFQIGERSNVLG